MELKIRKLNKELKDNYLHFFDDIAFCDNPAWSIEDVLKQWICYN